VKQEVLISPLRDYIQEWLNNYIAKISKISAKEVTIGPVTATNKSAKDTTTRKKSKRFHHSMPMFITYFFPYQIFIQLFFFFN